MNKKCKKPKSTAEQTLSPQSQALSAASLYSAGDYKNALSRYERVYKEHPDPLIKESLVACLLARSEQLSQKHMYLEASALFAKLQSLAPESLNAYDYLACLIKARAYEKAHALCQAYSLEQHLIPSEAAACLVAASIANPSASDALTSHFEQDKRIANQILASLDTNPSPESLLPQLKTISLRSALKDLRLLTQSMLSFQTNPEDALRLAKEIKSTSPYYAIAQVIIMACQTDIDLFMSLADLSTLQLNLLQKLKGWTTKQRDTLVTTANTLIKQGGAVKKIKYLSQLDNISVSILKPLCLSLYDGNNATWNLISTRFGEDLFVKYQFKAIQSEDKGEPWDCIRLWDECIAAIKKDTTRPQTMIGLIKLRQYFILSEQCCPNHEECADWLIESLDYLPSRKKTYTTLCEHYVKEGNKKLYEKWLSNMQKQFPEDTEVLLQTATQSIKKKTYTKAITLLKKALSLDSINVKAKQCLAQTYFEKAIYELSRKKFSNAACDLNHAKAMQQYMASPSLVFIAGYFLALSQGDKAMAQEQLDSAYKQSGNKFFINYLLHYCIAEWQLKIQGADDLLTWDYSNKNAFDALTQGMQEIRNYLKKSDIQRFLILDVNKHLKQQIACAIKESSKQEDFEQLCSLFFDLKWFASLLLTANTALKRHKKSSVFHYYQVQAQTKGNPAAISNKQYHALIDSLHRLPEDERSKTGALIAALLDKAEKYRKPSFLNAPFFNNMPDELADIFDELFV